MLFVDFICSFIVIIIIIVVAFAFAGTLFIIVIVMRVIAVTNSGALVRVMVDTGASRNSGFVFFTHSPASLRAAGGGGAVRTEFVGGFGLSKSSMSCPFIFNPTQAQKASIIESSP